MQTPTKKTCLTQIMKYSKRLKKAEKCPKGLKTVVAKNIDFLTPQSHVLALTGCATCMQRAARPLRRGAADNGRRRVGNFARGFFELFFPAFFAQKLRRFAEVRTYN